MEFSSIPEGVKVEWLIANGLSQWSVTEKPTGFDLDAERSLLEQLNTASLNIAKIGNQVFVKSDISSLKNAPIGESVASNATFKFNLKQDNEA
jgi:hypothetical protein